MIIAVIYATQAVAKWKPEKKIQGFEPMTSAIPMQCSSQLGAGHCVKVNIWKFIHLFKRFCHSTSRQVKLWFLSLYVTPCHAMIVILFFVYLQITQEGYKFISMGCSYLNTIILNELPGLRDDCIQVWHHHLGHQCFRRGAEGRGKNFNVISIEKNRT